LIERGPAWIPAWDSKISEKFSRLRFLGEEMTFVRMAAGLGLVLAAVGPVSADQPPVIHYAPSQNLESIDVALIDRAKAEIDFAAYILTDWAVMSALRRAADRGVKVRIYLGNERGSVPRTASPVFRELVSHPAIETRMKRAGAPLMHLKSYQIDRRLLRTGAANFTASGLKQQDNDLIVIESRAAAEEFRQNFEKIYAKGIDYVIGPDVRPHRRRSTRHARCQPLAPRLKCPRRRQKYRCAPAPA
jgi:phosphatidylserine/phosphatidylglycerophosphate/cardiolipin synthase-like enzyme